jgi:putative nucleotidyltransferase with HDIG domain
MSKTDSTKTWREAASRVWQDERLAAFLATAYSRWAALGAAFCITVLTVTQMPEPGTGTHLETIEKEIVASERVQASFSFETVDLQLTEEGRRAAEARVPHTYRVRQDIVSQQLAALSARLSAIPGHQAAVAERIAAALRTSTDAVPAEQVAATAVSTYIETLEAEPIVAQAGIEPLTLAVWLRPDPMSLPERLFAPLDDAVELPEAASTPALPAASAAGVRTLPRPVVGLEPDSPSGIVFAAAEVLRTLIREHLEGVLARGVRSASLPPDLQARRIVVVQDGATGSVSEEMALSDAPDAVRARENLRSRIEAAAKQWASVEGDTESDWGKLADAAMAVAAPFITDTLYQDEEATRQARMQKRNAVEPVMKEIQARETIVNEGERWDAQARSDARTYFTLLQNNEQPQGRFAGRIIAHMILALLALAGFVRALEIFGPKSMEARTKYLYIALLLMGSTLVIGRIAFYIEPTGFVVPVAASAILYAILVNVRLATMFTLVTAALVSAQYGYDWRVAVVGLSMSLAGIFSIYKVRRRSDMTAASLKAMGAGFLAMAAIILAMEAPLTETAARHMALIGLNGFICVFIVPGLLPLLEKTFSVTTDIQLLEYSDLNSEVLGQLAVKVPATWSHSLMIGQLAESVAEAIGANGLLTRVCAYYHDIGKMRRPDFFSENQRGENIHDRLSPRMSARTIAEHVSHGADVARSYHLPKPIVDAIYEHHGTCLISFFYSKALKDAKHGDVQESDFRYPGPKPQSRETAILMICDGVESGVRSIKNPNEDRVREFIDKIIKARLEDRQFDECDLTLKDLDTIAELLTKRVVGSLHTRIAYPEMKKDEGERNIIPMQGGGAP